LIEKDGIVKGVKHKSTANKELETFASLTVVCYGCFSNLRHSLCNPKVHMPSYFVGLVLEDCNLPNPNHGNVILANPSSIIFSQISSTEVCCLVDVPNETVPYVACGDMQKYLQIVVAP
jgi:squalene monooxygenase